MKREMRVVLCRVDEAELLDAFLREKGPQYVLVKGRSLPDGYKIERVVHNPLARCFDVLVSHESFSELADGMWVPEMEADWKVDVVPAPRADDDPIIVTGDK